MYLFTSPFLKKFTAFNVLCLVLGPEDELKNKTEVLPSPSFSHFMGYRSIYLMIPLFYSKRADLVGRYFALSLLPAAHLECEMMAATLAAILDHKVTLRM